MSNGSRSRLVDPSNATGRLTIGYMLELSIISGRISLFYLLITLPPVELTWEDRLMTKGAR